MQDSFHLDNTVRIKKKNVFIRDDDANTDVGKRKYTESKFKNLKE
jgi:hypothetical protein